MKKRKFQKSIQGREKKGFVTKELEIKTIF